MFLSFSGGVVSLKAMIKRQLILLALAACSVSAFSQETSKDEMWNMLNKSPGAGQERRFYPSHPATPRVQRKKQEPEKSVLQELYRSIALGTKKAGREKWPEANLKFEFGDGWMKADGDVLNKIAKTYYNTEKELCVVVNFIQLTQGETTGMEELLKQPAGTSSGTRLDLKPVEAKGRAAEMGMIVFEGTAKLGDTGDHVMVLGRMAGKGAVYGVCALAKDKETARQEFTRFVGTLAWIDQDKNLAAVPIAELSVAGAGFSIPCEGALFAPITPEQPFSSAASRLDQRLEITAFDVRGCEVPLRDLVSSYLEIMAVSTGGNHVLEDKSVGGVAGLRARPKRSSTLMGKELDWCADFALRDGFLCVAVGSWVKNESEYEKRHEEMVARIRFVKPDGKQRALENDAEKHFASMFYNEVGLKGYQRGQYSVSTRAFEHAAELNSKDANIALNLINSLTKQGKIKSALIAVEKARAELPEHQGIKQWHASLLIRSGREAEAAVLFEELFKGGLRDQEELGIWIETLQKTGKHERAAEIARTVFDETGQIAWRRILANCLWSGGKLDEARAHFKEMEADLGDEAGFASDHASLLLEAKDYKAVMELIGKWEKTNEAPAGMLFSKGMAQAGLEWYKDSVATFTKLDGMVPGNQTVKEALANAQAMMGRGSQEGIRDDLKEVTIPAALGDGAAEALAAADIEKDFAGEGSVLLSHIRVWDWSEGSDARMTLRQRIKILDASGVKSYSTLYVPFKPHAERVNINRMIVSDKNGKELASYRREEMHVRDGDGELANGEKVVCIPVPTLEEGAVIEFAYTKSLLGTDKCFPMATDGIPVYSALIYGAVAFTGEIGKLRFSATDSLKAVSNDSFHAFEARNLKRRIGTSHLPPYDRWGMMCWVCDNRTSWESETGGYLSEIRDCLADDAFAVKVVEDLKLAGKSPAEVTRCVVRWLNEKFQYQGLEFGRRARIPAKGEITLSRGFGDCKDLSLMVRAILRQAGVKANLALVNSSGIVRENMPSFDQFDHMVLHLPEMGGTVLDATMRHFNTPESLAITALGGRAFVIEGDKPGFVDMNEAVGAERFMTVDRNVNIDEQSGDAHVTEAVSLSPAEAFMMRYMLAATAGAEHLKTMETMLRRKESRIELKEFKIHDLDDPFQAFRMELDYVIPNAFQWDGTILSGTLPRVIEGWMFEMDQERDRSIGMMIHAAERCVINNHIQIPKGCKWIAPAELKREAAEPGSFVGTVEWQSQADGIHMDATMKLIPSSGEAELYQRVRMASDNMFRQLGERMRFGKE